MLNENLARVRKEHGLTQEALAAKLNVVRQTISKWENGTAVPDADTLCKIADTLDVSVAELLGKPDREGENMDHASIAGALAEINEQLAIRNRRSGNVLKIVCGIIVGLLILIIAIVVLNMHTGKTTIETTDSVEQTSAVDVSTDGFMNII